jgi:hypothetical protein
MDASGNANDLQAPFLPLTLASGIQGASLLNGVRSTAGTGANRQWLQNLSGATWMQALQAASSSVGKDITMLVVCNYVTDAASGTPYVAASMSAAANTDSHNSFSANMSSTGTPSTNTSRNTTNFGSAKNTTTHSKNTLLKIVARFDSSTGKTHVTVNSDADVALASAVGGTFNSPTWDTFTLAGQAASASPSNFDGYLFEVDLWATFANSTQVANLLSYASTKWN